MDVKRQVILGIGVMILMINSASAAIIYQEAVRNAYSFNIMPNVLVEIINSTGDTVLNDVSDLEGNAVFTLPYADNYTIRTSKAAYNENYLLLEILNSTQRIVYMTEATAPYAKFVYVDMTFFNHGLCLFTDGEHLLGCFYDNDTIKLTAGNYTAIMKANIYDKSATPEGFFSLIKRAFPYILMVMVGIGIIAAAGYIVIHMVKK